MENCCASSLCLLSQCQCEPWETVCHCQYQSSCQEQRAGVPAPGTILWHLSQKIGSPEQTSMLLLCVMTDPSGGPGASVHSFHCCAALNQMLCASQKEILLSYHMYRNWSSPWRTFLIVQVPTFPRHRLRTIQEQGPKHHLQGADGVELQHVKLVLPPVFSFCPSP